MATWSELRRQGDQLPIRLTVSNFWQELEQLRSTAGMPVPLVDCLKSLISSHIHSTIGPEATPHLIVQAQNHLLSGILLSDSGMDYLYDLVVFVPYSGLANRSFFTLIRKWGGGEVRYLKSFSALG